MKRVLTFALIFLVLLGGCSKKESSKVTLEFWTISLHPTYDKYIQGLISEYEKEHPHVKIEWIDMPSAVIMQKLMASIAGGVPPDVVNLNTSYSQIMAQNMALVCTDDTVPPTVKSLYFENLWKAAQFNGKSYGIPWYVTTRVVIYNKEIFKRAGVKHPPKNRQEIFDIAKKIKEKTGKYGYMPAIKIIEDFKMEGVPILTPDGKHAAFYTPEAVKILQWYVNLKNEKLIPLESLSEGYRGALNRYQSGDLAMLIAGPTLLMRIKKDAPSIYSKTDVAPMPLGKKNVVPAATMNLVIPRSSKHRKIAIDFALFVTNDKNQLAFCKLVPLLPSTKKAAKDEFFYKGKGDPLQDKAILISIQQLKKAQDMSLGVKNAPLLMRVLHEAVESAYYGRKTPNKALKEASQKWDEILSNN